MHSTVVSPFSYGVTQRLASVVLPPPPAPADVQLCFHRSHTALPLPVAVCSFSHVPLPACTFTSPQVDGQLSANVVQAARETGSVKHLVLVSARPSGGKVRRVLYNICIFVVRG